jgi:hypothetical protein
MEIDPPIDLSKFYDEEEEPKEKVPEVQPTVCEEDEDLSKSFYQLATTNPVKLKENVEVIHMNKNLLDDENATSHPLTRKEQRDVVNGAFAVSRDNLSKRNLIAAIRGSPGIGKSWSALLFGN